MKKIGLLLLIVLVAGGTYLYFNFNNLALSTTEKVASEALGLNVEIGAMKVELLDKKVTISNITIANLEGYQDPHIMEVAQVDIGLDTTTRELIDFNNIDVTGSVVNVEVNQQGMNVLELKKRLETKEPAQGSGQAASDPAPKSAAETIKVIVKKMAINATQINTRVAFIDRQLPSVTVPMVEFTNIGQGTGVNAGEAIVSVVGQYLVIIQQVLAEQNILSGLGVPEVDKALDSVGQKLGIQMDDQTKDAVKNSLKGLFK